MDTAKLKKFAQFARRSLMEQVAGKLKLVLSKESAARREYPQAVQELETQISTLGKEQVIEKVAYTWFNRFCALRFMDLNRYTRVGLVTPAEGQFQPEVLADAKTGYIDDERVPERIWRPIHSLLDGTLPSPDPQSEVYRLLLVAYCNYYHKAMPYLFERIDDFTELLMPEDLLSGSSILAYTREALTPDACKDVEVIGWLYQFYISEKKDEVFEGLKKNKKITPENIPAATQLFTPHWIVRYLVENSLGRLWMLNHPNSKLIDQMDYYIKPEEPETEFLKIGSPEEIKICDPACGSGHMLVYAYDLLRAIYEEEGYDPTEIPNKILTHNLYGIEIDERAGELAAFALTMKGQTKRHRFLRRDIRPNICVLQNISFEDGELAAYMDFIGRDLFTIPLQATLHQFEEADNFGSLIRPEVTDVEGLLAILEAKNVSEELFLNQTHQKVLQVLRQAEYLSPKYHVVITNPPYMGSKGMNESLTSWTKRNFPNCWDRGVSDLYVAFIERVLQLALPNGSAAMITMQGWMFASSYETLRSVLLHQNTLCTTLHLGARAFDSIGGEVVSTSAFVFKVKNNETILGSYYRLTDGDDEASKERIFLESKYAKASKYRFVVNSSLFDQIPGFSVSYWINSTQLKKFTEFSPISSIAKFKAGLSTGDNAQFQRYWQEVSITDIVFGCTSASNMHGRKWVPCNSGGSFRKWYGNNEVVICWKDCGAAIKAHKSSAIRNESDYFRPGLTYSKISSGRFACRTKELGYIFDDTGRAIVCAEDKILLLQAFLSSAVASSYLEVLAPSLSFTSKELERIPMGQILDESVSRTTIDIVAYARRDWDSYERSWDFSHSPVLKHAFGGPLLLLAYKELRSYWQNTTYEMRRLEKENNLTFIAAYDLLEELTPEVPLSEITLTCNPHYRYGNDKSEEELEALLLADTMKEFISYAVGCMFGRYALDKPGLILANQGETIEDYYKALEVSEGSVEPLSVHLKRNAKAHCFRCGLTMEHADALFVLHRYEGNQFAGRPMVYCKRCADEYGDLSVLPLAEFCYKRAITQQWSHRASLEQFLEMAECFEYETVKEVRDAVPFPADEDNVIPIIDGDWFADDITERFYNFLRVTFGEEHFEENLQFLEKAIGKDVRKYFLKDFYNDHVKRYKKRPIYWLFSSPKGSFSALIYMHRYRPDTVSVVLNNYLREFRTKLSARKGHLETLSISASASQGEKTKALKEIEKLNKVIEEMEDYERDVLYPLATEQIAIDLDDGVKVNYLKFGAALKKIAGLDKTED